MINIFCNSELKKILKENNVEEYLPAYGGESAGLDLYNTGSDIELLPVKSLTFEDYKKTLIPTGLHLSLNKDYVAYIKERGSIVKTPLKVRAGVIDAGYTDEIFVNLVNLSSQVFTIKHGERLPVQIVVVKCDNHYNELSENEYLSLTQASSRKKGKIGSSN
tara:strand:+ start:1503 stop:1988 length:486 start_codon:yes stop_codon:yes gene_type:complete